MMKGHKNNGLSSMRDCIVARLPNALWFDGMRAELCGFMTRETEKNCQDDVGG